MSENTDNTPTVPVVPAVDAYTATVTVLTPTTRIVTIPKEEFFKGYGPSAKAGVEGRIDSLMTGYIERNKEDLLPGLPENSQIIRVDVQKEQ